MDDTIATPTVGARSTIIYPALRYVDAPAAIEFLERAFGFSPYAVYKGEDGSIAHAELELAGAMIMLGSSRDDDLRLVSPKETGNVTACLYVFVDELDAHYARATEAGADIVRPLADTNYGSREYMARDLEGQLWSFGTYRPGAPASM